MYIYIYIYTHVYIYIYIYTHVLLLKLLLYINLYLTFCCTLLAFLVAKENMFFPFSPPAFASAILQTLFKL